MGTDFMTGEGLDGMSIMINSCINFMPGVGPGTYSPEHLASYEYQRACLPLNTIAWENDPEKPTTFRITKKLLAGAWRFTIQFRVSEFPRHLLHTLTPHLGGLQPDYALYMERTRRKGG